MFPFKTYKTALAKWNARLVGPDELPLDQSGFWRTAIYLAAAPANSSDEPELAVKSAAQELIEASLPPTTAQVRRDALLDGVRHGEVGVRLFCLCSLKDSIAEAEQAILNVAIDASHDPSLVVRLAAVSLISHIQSGQATASLLELLVHAEDARVNQASEALVARGEAALPGLAAVLKNPDSRARWRAVNCLVREPTLAQNALLHAFHDDSPDVARVAVKGLLALGPAAGGTVLRSFLKGPLKVVTVEALHSYAASAQPSSLFRPIWRETTGLAGFTAALTAVSRALGHMRYVARTRPTVAGLKDTTPRRALAKSSQ